MRNFEIGTAGAGDLATLREWAADEGWNPGDRDLTAFQAADPRGFLVGRLDGEPVASVSAVRHGPGFGFLGLYIARPQVRGQGYGMRMWRAAMDRLGGRNVGLDGVVAQQENYRRSGFHHAWNHLRYEGTVPVSAAEVPGGTVLVDGRSLPFAVLADHDRRHFPGERDAFLSQWVTQPAHTSLAAVGDGGLRGFAVARPAARGTRVGPLHADSEAVAHALLTGLAATAPPAPLVLDVPDVNAPALRLVERLGFTPVFECARMYTGPVPDTDTSGVFGVTSIEVG
ncbi:GNAT family N-acetyltransferase [Streptomyces avicenniae]|uniref:GNAT family N-acetyltransferase n=1 Tax=Streptomyces avicenniae TaxID=500153 RepID=UPI00069B6197|nr:GNAT family N-acetyltransferase [Streptomyces avicenniae]